MRSHELVSSLRWHQMASLSLCHSPAHRKTTSEHRCSSRLRPRTPKGSQIDRRRATKLRPMWRREPTWGGGAAARAERCEMARLDEAEQSARVGAEDDGLDPTEAVDFLRNLPALWEEAPNSRRALAESLFESVDVLGLDTMHVEPTPAAVRRGLAEAFRADELVMVGARGLEPRHRRHLC